MIIEQTIDLAGKIRIQWQSIATGNVYSYKFETEPTVEQLESLCSQSDKQAELSSVQPLRLSIDEPIAIREFIEKVKGSPDMVLSQYNAYLGTLTWNNAASIRSFVYQIAKRLSERKEVSLSGWTEGIVVREVRDFIVDTSIEVLERLIFSE